MNLKAVEAHATSCQVCPGRAPLWEIRAAQVIHDKAAEQLYFEDARVALGEKYGLSCPVNAALTSMIRYLEARTA